MWPTVSLAMAFIMGAVPSFLALYMACTPCTALVSHAAWGTNAEFEWEIRRSADQL
jgi:hypothetical protein